MQCFTLAHHIHVHAMSLHDMNATELIFVWMLHQEDLNDCIISSVNGASIYSGPFYETVLCLQIDRESSNISCEGHASNRGQ